MNSWSGWRRQTWRLLRHDQELPIATARTVVLRLVEAVLAQCAD